MDGAIVGLIIVVLILAIVAYAYTQYPFAGLFNSKPIAPPATKPPPKTPQQPPSNPQKPPQSGGTTGAGGASPALPGLEGKLTAYVTKITQAGQPLEDLRATAAKMDSGWAVNVSKNQALTAKGLGHSDAYAGMVSYRCSQKLLADLDHLVNQLSGLKAAAYQVQAPAIRVNGIDALRTLRAAQAAVDPAIATVFASIENIATERAKPTSLKGMGEAVAGTPPVFYRDCPEHGDSGMFGWKGVASSTTAIMLRSRLNTIKTAVDAAAADLDAIVAMVK